MPLTVEQLNANLKREHELWTARDDMAVDIRIAERAGDEAAIMAAKDAEHKRKADWYALLTANRVDLYEWLIAAGFDRPDLVGRSLYR